MQLCQLHLNEVSNSSAVGHPCRQPATAATTTATTAAATAAAASNLLIASAGSSCG